MKNDELLHKWVNDQLNEEELEIFKRRPEYKSLAGLYKKIDQLSVPGFDEDKMLADILNQKKSTEKQPPARRRLLISWMKYAAAAVLLLAVWSFWPTDKTMEYTTINGQQLEGRLPNGSTFVLNAESSLVYNRATWDTERSIQLIGEAFFEVEKGKPFKVHTLNGMVEVLGTKFNVWSRKQLLEVRCHTGKVAVSALDKSRQIIVENESVRIVAGEIAEKENTTGINKPTWIEGLSKFRNVPLAIVLDELERQFDVIIDARQVDVEEVISCNFEHNNLDLALKTSLASLGINYENKNDRVVVLGNE